MQGRIEAPMDALKIRVDVVWDAVLSTSPPNFATAHCPDADLPRPRHRSNRVLPRSARPDPRPAVGTKLRVPVSGAFRAVPTATGQCRALCRGPT